MSLPFKEWNDLSKLTGNILRPGGLQITQKALNNCNFSHEHYLLDLGCGLGGTAEYLSSLGLNVLGLDISRQMLKDAYAKIHTAKSFESEIFKMPAFIQGDINYLPLRSSCLHGIFCECVLSLIPDIKAILLKLHSILQCGGKLIISDIVDKNPVADLNGENKSLAKENSESVQNILCGDKIFTENAKISCVDGALVLNELKDTLSEIGFKLILEKDYSRALCEFAAMLVLHDLHIGDYFINDRKDCKCKQSGDLGYVLLIAEKI